MQCGGAGFRRTASLELHRHVKNASGSEVYLDSVVVFNMPDVFYQIAMRDRKAGYDKIGGASEKCGDRICMYVFMQRFHLCSFARNTL